ncbi:MAG: hypothetical protein AAGJ12_00655 [Bacteroidota bacterium]
MTPPRTPIKSYFTIISLFLLGIFVFSCSDDSETLDDNTMQEEQTGEDPSDDGNNDMGDGSTDDNGNQDDNGNGSNGDNGNSSSNCPNGGSSFFTENNGLVSVEFENTTFQGDWELRNDANDVSGQGYMVWTGQQRLGQPGEGKATFLIEIGTPGTYQFLWKSSFRLGDNGTEHNDTWLRFPDADDFFGEKDNGSIVYPKGSGKQPNPEGSSADGWFKIYRSGNDNSFLWQARTSDNDAHDIFITFNTAGIYTMEISARSSFHGIDRFILFESDLFTRQSAINAADMFSVENNCD